MLAIVPHTSSIADARPAVDAVLRIGADRMLADRMLIELALELEPFTTDTMTVDSLVEVCRGRLAIMLDLGRRGHRAYDANRMLALRQAEMALFEVADFGSWAEARRARIGQFAIAAE